MHPLALTAAREIEAESGQRFNALADFAALARLNLLAVDVTSPEPPTNYSAALWPSMTAGGVTFWRLSLGLEEFEANQLQAWYADKPRQLNVALCYLLAHAKTPAAVWEYHSDPAGFDRAVTQWARTVALDYPTLCARVREFMLTDQRRQDQEQRPRTPNQDAQERAAAAAELTGRPVRADNGWLVELLVSEYGQTPHFWIWEAPLDHIELCIKNYERRMEAEAMAAAHARGQGIGNPYSKAQQALRRFRAYTAELKATMKARNMEAPANG